MEPFYEIHLKFVKLRQYQDVTTQEAVFVVKLNTVQ
jgi:hypothetical protein